MEDAGGEMAPLYLPTVHAGGWRRGPMVAVSVASAWSRSLVVPQQASSSQTEKGYILITYPDMHKASYGRPEPWHHINYYCQKTFGGLLLYPAQSHQVNDKNLWPFLCPSWEH